MISIVEMQGHTIVVEILHQYDHTLIRGITVHKQTALMLAIESDFNGSHLGVINYIVLADMKWQLTQRNGFDKW